MKNLQLYVNLAGTTNTESNAPYDEGDPFYYILMDTSQSNTNGYEPTIDLPLHKVESCPPSKVALHMKHPLFYLRIMVSKR